MEKIEISVGTESSKEEVELIIESFADIPVVVNKDMHRFSHNILPLVIEFTFGAVAGGILYDAIKMAVIKIVDSKSKQNIREPTVVINRKNKSVIISKKGIMFSSSEKQIIVNSIDEAISKIDKDT